MTLEELLRAFMTPVPKIKEMTPQEWESFKGKIPSIPNLPSLPEKLPSMPLDWQKYAIERGLVPPGTTPGVGGMRLEDLLRR